MERLLAAQPAILLVTLLLFLFAMPRTARAGDYFRIIVPERVFIPVEEAQEKTERMIAWMQERGLIEREPSDCTLNPVLGYRITPRGVDMIKPEHKRYFASHHSLLTFGVAAEYQENKDVVHSGQGGLESARCPKCEKDMGPDAFYDLVSVWYKAEGNPPLQCPLCGKESEVSAFLLEPQWGFSNVSFFFWNLPGDFDPAFIKAFSGHFGEPVRVVQGKL